MKKDGNGLQGNGMASGVEKLVHIVRTTGYKVVNNVTLLIAVKSIDD